MYRGICTEGVGYIIWGRLSQGIHGEYAFAGGDV
jgi:hypothetical protein